MNKTPALLAAALLISLPVLAAPPPAAPAAPGTASPAPAAAPVAADDLAALRAHLNTDVDVRGTPTAIGHNKTGNVLYLNFGRPHQAMSVVVFLKGGAENAGAGKVRGEDDLKPFIGKSVLVHGKLTDYNGDLQIVLDTLNQIRTAP